MGAFGRVMIVMVASGILIFGVGSWQTQLGTRKVLQSVAVEQLVSLRDNKKIQLEAYFSDLRSQVVKLAQSPVVMQAVHRFTAPELLSIKHMRISKKVLKLYRHALMLHYQNAVLPRLGFSPTNAEQLKKLFPTSDEAIYLQYHYVVNNPHDIQNRDRLDEATDGSDYSRIHAQYHPLFRVLKDQMSLYDLFLVGAENGRIVYSVFKEIDFATSLDSGPFYEQAIARLYKRVKEASQPRRVFLMDMTKYSPSYGAPAIFIATGVFSSGKMKGVLAMQVPLEAVNNIVSAGGHWEELGLGQTGEAYVVGPDKTMRTESRFIKGEEPFSKEINSVAFLRPGLAGLVRSHSRSVLHQNVGTRAVGEA